MFILILLLLGLLAFLLPDFVIEVVLETSIKALTPVLDLILRCFDLLQEAIRHIVT